MRELRNQTADVIAAVESGERVTLTVRGRPVADIVPHGARAPWLSGTHLRRALSRRSADAGLTAVLDDIAGNTLDEVAEP